MALWRRMGSSLPNWRKAEEAGASSWVSAARVSRRGDGLRKAGGTAWGVLLPDHVRGFKIFLLRSLTCSRKNN